MPNSHPVHSNTMYSTDDTAVHRQGPDNCADLLKRGRSTMPLLPSKSWGTALWDVHVLLRLDHKSPDKSALEARYTL